MRRLELRSPKSLDGDAREPSYAPLESAYSESASEFSEDGPQPARVGALAREPKFRIGQHGRSLKLDRNGRLKRRKRRKKT